MRAGFSLTRIGFALAEPERTQRSFTAASGRRMFTLEHGENLSARGSVAER